VPDAYAIFNAKDATSERRRGYILSMWPELHAELLRSTRLAVPAVVPCALYHDGHRPPASGRVTLNGTPACSDHLSQNLRPGGYPLALTDPRELK
jgi:hypothetical protein